MGIKLGLKNLLSLFTLDTTSNDKLRLYGVIGLVIFGAIVLILMAIFNYKQFKKVVYDFVILAEYYIKGTKKGQERFDYVVREIHKQIPAWLGIFLTEARIKKIIEWAVSKMKKSLAKGENVFDKIEFKIDEWKDEHIDDDNDNQ